MQVPNEMSGQEISTESRYGMKTKQPLVVLRWGKESGVMTPDEARRFALRVLATAEASVGDAFWLEFAQNDIKLAPADAIRLMGRYREWRLRTEEEN